jgi:hypothetical protein
MHEQRGCKVLPSEGKKTLGMYSVSKATTAEVEAISSRAAKVGM